MEGRLKLLFWGGVILIVLYLSWKTVSSLITSMFFGVTLAYIVYPLHKRLEKNIGTTRSALLLTAVMVAIGALTLAVIALLSINFLQTFYENIGSVLNWLLSVELPEYISGFLQGLRANLMPLLAEYVSSFTFSVPSYLLQLIVFLLAFYYSLVYSRDFVPFVFSMIPADQRGFVAELLSHADRTMNALVRAWLLLNVAKGLLMTVGYIIFGVSDVYTAVIAGFLTFVFSFVPLLEGWMLWLAAAVYLYLSGSLLLAVGISIYGAVLVSPLPDYTIRPMLVARDADLDETLVFVGMLGGMWAFGLKGLLLGPIILNMGLVILKEWKRAQKYVKGQSIQPT